VKHCVCECLDQQYLITFPQEDWQILWSAGLCLSFCTSQKPHVQTSWHFLCVLAVAVAQSSSDDSAVHYVLPVLRMTSGFHIVWYMWCMARLTATGCQSAEGNAEGRHWSASALPVCIASLLTNVFCMQASLYAMEFGCGGEEYVACGREVNCVVLFLLCCFSVAVLVWPVWFAVPAPVLSTAESDTVLCFLRVYLCWEQMMHMLSYVEPSYMYWCHLNLTCILAVHVDQLVSYLVFTALCRLRRVLCPWLWSPYVIGRPYIFSSCFFFFLLSSFFFFPRLISAVGDWMSTILRHMVWS